MTQDIVKKLGQFTDEQQSALRRVWEQRVLYTDHPDFKNRGFRDWILSDCHKGVLKLGDGSTHVIAEAFAPYAFITIGPDGTGTIHHSTPN
jgi:hypothetical protein